MLRGSCIDLNHGSTPGTDSHRQRWSDEFAAKLEPHVQPFDWEAVKALAEQMAAEPPRENWSLGARLIGDECSRRVQYEVQHAFWGTIPQREPLDAASFDNFARGIYGEEWMRNLLRRAGFHIARYFDGGESLGFSAAGGQFRGNIDGWVNMHPRWFTPFLKGVLFLHVWEHKCVGDKSWRAIYSHGLAKAKPQYADQVSLYQYHMHVERFFARKYAGNPIGHALFTAHNADTGQIYAELVKFDPKRCQAAIDRAALILSAMRAREMLPRAGSDSDSWPCGWRDKATGEMKGCRFRQECWS